MIEHWHLWLGLKDQFKALCWHKVSMGMYLTPTRQRIRSHSSFDFLQCSLAVLLGSTLLSQLGTQPEEVARLADTLQVALKTRGWGLGSFWAPKELNYSCLNKT